MRSAGVHAVAAAALWAAFTLMVVAAPAHAHTPGAEPVVRQGNFTLHVGPPQNEFHVYFSEMGFPIAASDTFEILWSVNGGQGPEVFFEIHTHENGWTRYYATNASALDITWVVPQANDSFMIYWVNPWSIPVNVTYSIVDKAPPPDLTPLIILPLSVGAAFGWFLWLRSVPGEELEGMPGGPGDAGGGGGQGADERPLDDAAFQEAVEEAERGKTEGGGGQG
jgi:hypothetical protein